MKLTKAATKLYKSYLFTVVVKEMKKLADVDYGKKAKAARKLMRNMDFDKTLMLRKIGLTPWRPMRTGIGGGLLLLCGAGLGALAAMALSPMRGDEFRKTLKHKADDFIHRNDLGQTQAPAEA